ncbi:TOMM precursor leader peptide-binding protein [Frankia sp. CcWB3]
MRKADVFAPGHHLYRAADGSWRYSAPGNVFVRIGGEDRLLALVRDVAAGATQLPLPDVDRPAVERMTAALTDRGVFVGPGRVGTVPAGWKVRLDGDSPVVGKLTELLGDLLEDVECTVGPADEAAVAGSDVVVSCARWLPDSHWCRLDQWCAAHHTPWHGCYAEGDTFVVGPLSMPGRTACYQDTRGRRLAAAALPDELIAHWAYLDSDTVKPPAPFTPAATAVLAGLLAADLRALAAGSAVPSEGHQLVVDLTTASISRHPVLPLPNLAVNPV